MVSHSSQALPGALAGGDDASHRGGEQGLLVGQGIGLGVVEQAAPGAQANDPACSRLDDLPHVVVAHEWGWHEHGPLLFVNVDAVEHEDMEVGIEVQR